MITIITVYKSNNYGSFRQAKVLGDVLSEYDEIQYLDFGQRKWVDLFSLISIVRNTTKGFSLKKIKFILNVYFKNYQMWKTLKAIKLKNLRESGNDVFVIGSDEIWNLSRKNCRYPLFWGKNVNGKKISYAPSINDSSEECLKKYSISDCLNEFTSLSVRDEYSKKMLSKFTEKNISIVLDPTLLVDSTYYLKQSSYKKLPFRYIAIYVFPGSNDVYREMITKFANEKKCKIVSIGTYLSWCDFCLTAKDCENPFLYYLDAEYVFANTFHGTAFAINFEKQFFSFAISKKIRNLLEQFDLLCRNIDVQTSSFDCLNSIASNNINYAIVNEKKEVLRKKSFDFIANTFGSIQGKSYENSSK